MPPSDLLDLLISVHVLPPLHTKYACPHKIGMFYMSREPKKQIHASRQAELKYLQRGGCCCKKGEKLINSM